VSASIDGRESHDSLFCKCAMTAPPCDRPAARTQHRQMQGSSNPIIARDTQIAAIPPQSVV
jgi:hypothetical protein